MASGQANSEPLYDPPRQEDVAVLLYSVTDWYSVGLKLGLPTAELDEIRYGGSPKEQKKKLARVWLDAIQKQGESPTWERLRTILEELKMVRAVETIDKRYRKGKRETTLPIQSSRPTMAHLHCIHGTNGEHYRIIQECASQWKIVADFLLQNSASITREMERDPQLISPSEKCRAVFEKWINNQMIAREPVTWNELLSVLDDLEKGVLANDLRKYALQQE